MNAQEASHEVSKSEVVGKVVCEMSVVAERVCEISVGVVGVCETNEVVVAAYETNGEVVAAFEKNEVVEGVCEMSVAEGEGVCEMNGVVLGAAYERTEEGKVCEMKVSVEQDGRGARNGVVVEVVYATRVSVEQDGPGAMNGVVVVEVVCEMSALAGCNRLGV
jgi:flagellar hook assembly protein FlgD